MPATDRPPIEATAQASPGRGRLAAILSPTLGDLWTFLAIALPVLAALVAAMPAVDLAFQLRAGGSILDAGGVPTSDTWTFTVAGTAWVDQQWAAQAVLAALFRLGGWSGLVLLRAGLVGLAFALLWLTVRRRAPELPARTASLLVLAAFLVAAPTLALRPQLPAIVLFAAMLLLLADRGAHPRRIWLIPVLAFAWANLHGTFPLAILLVGLAWLAELSAVGLRARSSLELLAVGAAAVIATLINPFGLGVWGYVVNVSSDVTIASRVSEWRPPALTDVPGLLFWVSVLAVVGLVVLRTRRRHAMGGRWLRVLPPWPGLLTLLAFAALGAVTERGLAWWPFAAVFVCAGLLRAPSSGSGADGPASGSDSSSDSGSASMAPGRDRPDRPTGRPARGSRVNASIAGIAGLLVLVGVALLPVWRPLGAAGVPNGVLAYAPQGIAVRLRDLTAATPGERVWNPQLWGSWLELAVPGARYAVDSRIELFPASTWADYDTVESGTGAWDDVLDRYGVPLVITDAGTDTNLEAALQGSGAWGRVYRDADGSVWARFGH